VGDWNQEDVMLKIKDYMLSPREFQVMLGLLAEAVQAGVLTEDQLAQFADDPLDIVQDLKGKSIMGVLVTYQEKDK
jgi:hypothetical protein